MAIMLAMALILTARLSGTIVSDGAPLPGCTVTVERPPVARTAVTNADGKYIFYALPPGQYELTTELAGMDTIRRLVVIEDGANELPAEEMAVAPAIQQITITCTSGVCSNPGPKSRWDSPSCSEYDENSRLIERIDIAELRKRYDTTLTLIERHRIGAALLGRIKDDGAIRRELAKYAALASGLEVTPELEAWSLERNLDPLNVIAIAAHARRVLADATTGGPPAAGAAGPGPR